MSTLKLPPGTPQPELKFPLDWEFRVILDGARAEAAREAVLAVFHEFGLAPASGFGEQSATGKYRALRLGCNIDSRETLEAISARLSQIDGVKFLM